jgi:hypothetical protein
MNLVLIGTVDKSGLPFELTLARPIRVNEVEASLSRIITVAVLFFGPKRGPTDMDQADYRV